jgi:hypothetical protein
VPLPAFATVDDLEARGVDVTNEERAQAALDDASALIRLEVGASWTTTDEDPVAIDFGDMVDYLQDAVVAVCVAVARRVLENPDGATSMSLGDASLTLANASNDVYLTSRERATLRRAAGRSALGSVDLEIGTPGYSGYIDVGQTELLPFTYEPLRP